MGYFNFNILGSRYQRYSNWWKLYFSQGISKRYKTFMYIFQGASHPSSSKFFSVKMLLLNRHFFWIFVKRKIFNIDELQSSKKIFFSISTRPPFVFNILIISFPDFFISFCNDNCYFSVINEFCCSDNFILLLTIFKANSELSRTAFSILAENGSLDCIAQDEQTFNYWQDGINTLLGSVYLYKQGEWDQL